MKFAALQSSHAADVKEHHPWLESIDSIVLIVEQNDRIHLAVRSDAILGIARYLGGPWRLAGVFRLVPRSIRDWAYDLIANNRYRWFARYDSCPKPEAETRHRFLE